MRGIAVRRGAGRSKDAGGVEWDHAGWDGLWRGGAGWVLAAMGRGDVGWNGVESDVGTASSYRRVASLCAYMYGMEKCTGAWPEADSERGLRRLVKFLFELTEGKPFPERLRLLLDI